MINAGVAISINRIMSVITAQRSFVQLMPLYIRPERSTNEDIKLSPPLFQLKKIVFYDTNRL